MKKMKILVLNGSPKREKSDTMNITRAFLDGMGETREHVMICGCGFPNSRNNFEPVVDQFKKLFPRNHTIITIPEGPMFNAPEAAPVTVPRLELVKKAGKIYAENFCVPEDLLAEIKSPMIPEEQYARIVNQ